MTWHSTVLTAAMTLPGAGGATLIAQHTFQWPHARSAGYTLGACKCPCGPW